MPMVRPSSLFRQLGCLTILIGCFGPWECWAKADFCILSSGMSAQCSLTFALTDLPVLPMQAFPHSHRIMQTPFFQGRVNGVFDRFQEFFDVFKGRAHRVDIFLLQVLCNFVCYTLNVWKKSFVFAHLPFFRCLGFSVHMMSCRLLALILEDHQFGTCIEVNMCDFLSYGEGFFT